jgi:hypothetical protein
MSLTGWSVGNCEGMPRTPIFQLSTLDNLWCLGVHRYVQPKEVVDWMGGPDTFEVGALGCDPFTGSMPPPFATTTAPTRERGVPPSAYAREGDIRGRHRTETTGTLLPTVAATVSWPANVAQARERPIYAVLDLKKIDVGIPDFGPVCVPQPLSTLTPLTNAITLLESPSTPDLTPPPYVCCPSLSHAHTYTHTLTLPLCVCVCVATGGWYSTEVRSTKLSFSCQPTQESGVDHAT